jgi:c-di-GMP-binding flagellar brake protein YcgR
MGQMQVKKGVDLMMDDQNKRGESGSSSSEKRRYVRLEIFSPVEFSAVVVEDDKRVRLHPDKKAGILLNLSGGGALISTTDSVDADSLLLMKFNIKGFDSLANILCRVKRVEESEDGECLFGVQFLTVEELDDPEVAAGLSRLTAHPEGFETGISRLISRYVFQRQVETETDQ